MVIPGNHEDSFSSTEPFGFSGATYFLPMSGMLGVAIVSAFAGTLSDKVGRRPVLLACVGGSVIATIGKYLARDTFWGFCATSFVNGLLGGTLPVAMAYVSDIHPSRAEKDKEIGGLVGQNMIAITGGGIAAILMQNTGLFTPLLLAAALNFAAFCFMYMFLIEPHGKGKALAFAEETSEEDENGPETIDKKLFSNVIVGALFDNVGSAGLFPLALSPLAFETFYLNFVLTGQEPIMSENAYRWIMMLLAIMVIPGAIMSIPIFQRFSAAGGCIFGNVVTAIGISSCILIATVPETTEATFGGYVAFLYLIMPFTVISQLSTGPMLDMLAPVNRRGFVQGLNTAVMNGAQAVTPFLLGTLADQVGTEACMWTCVGISVLAALVNAPLLFSPLLKPRKTREYLSTHPKDWEQTMCVDKLLTGEWVPAQVLTEINEERFGKGIPFLVPKVRPYSEDKPDLKTLKQHSREDFEYLKIRQYYYLSVQSESPEKMKEIFTHFKKSQPSKKVQDETAEGIGKWFADYTKDNGYYLDGGSALMMKEMIMQAFPPMNKDGDILEENLEAHTLRWAKLLNDNFQKSQPSRAAQAFRNSVVC